MRLVRPLAINANALSNQIGIWKCWFLRRGGNRSTRRKNARSKGENLQQTKPTYDAESGNRTRVTLVEGGGVLSPLRHPWPQGIDWIGHV